MTRSAPCYNRRPIGTVSALGRALQVAPSELIALAQRADKLYRVARVIEKDDGSKRVTYEALGPLKSLQKRILGKILREVDFPVYLMGGIAHRGAERGYIPNAHRHAGAAILIREDITNFFPSVTAEQIRRVFLHVFKFPRDVATLLARLCTRRGFLPQGAAPSTYLANLVLYGAEPDVQTKFAAAGVAYTRFIDDITVSSAEPLPKDIVSDVVGTIRALVEREGFKVNRRKQAILGRGAHRTVHNLNVNGQRATLPQPERKKIRAAVFDLERAAIAGYPRQEFLQDWQRAMGRVSRLQALHPIQGSALKHRLRIARTRYQGDYRT